MAQISVLFTETSSPLISSSLRTKPPNSSLGCFVQMGTKVQSKGYMPGYYPIRDISEDASSSWSWYHTYKSLNGHLSNGFVPRPVSGYLEYDKEMLKRTMLEHEAIFRKQVYELHRLYQTQKDLMDEFQNKGFYRLSVPADTAQSNSFSSPLPSDGTKKTWPMSNLHVGHTSLDKAPASGADDMRPALNFLKEVKGQSGLISIKNGVSQDGELLVSRSRRRMFDLRLPADVFIHSEEASKQVKENVAGLSFRSASPLGKICAADSDNDVKLTLSTCEGHTCRSDGWNSDSWTQNGHSSDILADLNRPVKETCSEAAMDSASTHFLCLRTCGEENQGPKMSLSSNTSFLGLQKDFLKSKYTDEGTSSNFLNVDGETRQERLFFNNENGKIRLAVDFISSGLCHDKFPMSSESVYEKFKKDHEVPLPEWSKAESLFRPKPTHGIEVSRNGLFLDTSNSSGLIPPSMPSLASVFHPKDYPSVASSLASSLLKPVNNIRETSVAAQALQCIKGSSTSMNISCSNAAIFGTSSANWQNNGDSRSCLQAGGNASSYQNGFRHCFQLDFNAAPHLQHSSITSAKDDQNSSAHARLEGQGSYGHPTGSTCKDGMSCWDLNLNQAPSNGVRDGNTTEQDNTVNDPERKCTESSGEIPWLRQRPVCNESVDSKASSSQTKLSDHCRLTSSSNAAASDSEGGKETGMCPSNLLSFSAPLQTTEGKGMQTSEVSHDTSNRGIFRLPFLDKIQQNAAAFSSSVAQERRFWTSSVTECKEVTDFDLACDTNSEKQILSEIAVTKGGKEVAVASPLSVPSVSPKPAPSIDLEMPAAQPEEHTISQQQQQSSPSSKLSSPAEADRRYDALIRVAAENLVAMSVDTNRHGEEITWQQSSPAKFDALYWFADQVISSNIGEACRALKGSGDRGSESSDDDGLDLFEAMTLKLEETKVDEQHCCDLKEQENKMGEDMGGAASLLFTRPRRGQAARRRQQRRDFQKDILPGLASLSRHEVSEDLQTIGGLMKASGKPWQTKGLTRRAASRSGLHAQAKVIRRQSRSLAVAVQEEIKVTPFSPAQPINTEPEVDGRSVMGWGRTTRRCRRQRCPQG